MRFAYIDSQGNEVPIPGVDALALRIELGAIGPDTRLYDAQADRWGPARTHEIFVTLAREAEEEGFVAPPPPVAPTPEPGAPVAPEEDAPARSPEAREEARPGEGDPGGPTAPDRSAPLSADAGLDFELTLTGEDASTPPLPEPSPPEAGEEKAPLSFELADDVLPASAPPPDGEAGEEDDLFPLGLGEEDERDPFDFGVFDAPDAEDERVPDGGLELEPPLSDPDALEPTEDASGGLELERPMSEFTHDAPPAWMEQDGPGGMQEEEGEMMGFDLPDEPAAGPPSAPRPAPSRPARPASRASDPPSPPRARPSPPRRRTSRRSVGAPLVGLLAVVVLGAGGWLGWRAMQDGGSEPGIPDFPPVTLPEVPAELLPIMRDVGEEALTGTVETLEEMAAEAELAEQPRNDWLSGVYLANAGDYPEVAAYWEGLEAFVARVRRSDTRIFHEEAREALAGREMADQTAALLLARADSGFLDTRGERYRAYEQMGDLVDASLELHQFLLANQARIDYDPAAGGMSADPVLEAVPEDPELGEEMWDRVDRITGALDRLGTLDRVTTERLLAVLFERIRQAGLR